MDSASLPPVIQGGMGAGVSNWRLARAVARTGQLGVVAGTGLDGILARRLQLGDPDGAMRRALAAFPVTGVAARILGRYFVPGGKPADAPFKASPAPSMTPSRHLLELLVAANFVEVFLAREGHDAPVGINYLEKIQAPTLPSLFGAMLAGVSVVLMGAGIPLAVPGILDRLAVGHAVELRIDVADATPDTLRTLRFDPADFLGGPAPALIRPLFLAIVSSDAMAAVMARRASGRVDGFVVEGPSAGGHNAPPRGGTRLGADGAPVYGARDRPDLAAIASHGLPFWLAGSYGRPGGLAAARALGAAGIQVGTAFAYSVESGIAPEIKRRVLDASRAGTLAVRTDPRASPTGFPFKVVQLAGTLADDAVSEARPRVCDLGFLRSAYRKADGSVGWRCPGERPEDYLRKGGAAADTVGRKCVCNGLMSTIGMAQTRSGYGAERPLVTSGDEVVSVADFLRPGADHYGAAEVVDRLLGRVAAPAAGITSRG